MVRQIVKITDHVTKITLISNVLWQFCGFGARSVDITDHQTCNTSCRGKCGWRELFNVAFSGLDGLVSTVTVLLQLVSSSPCNSCVEELHNQHPQLSTSIDSSGPRSSSASVNRPTPNLRRTSRSFRFCHECTPMQSRTAGAFAEWATFTVEDVQVCALLDTGASRTVGGHTMVQHVIDSLLQQQTPTWMESAEPAVIFTVAGGDMHNLGRRCGFRSQERTQNSSLCPRGSERSDPDLVRTRHDPGVWSRDRCLTLIVSQHSTSPSNPDDGDAFWTLGNFTVAAELSKRPQKQVAFSTQADESQST